MTGEIEFQKKTERVEVKVANRHVSIVREGRLIQFEVYRTSQGHQLTCDGKVFDVQVTYMKGEEVVVSVNGRSLRFKWRDDRSLLSDISAAANGSGGFVRAAMAGRVARIHVQSGTAVSQGDPLMVLEAMKMQNDVKASCAGIVEEILVAQGASVELDALLVRIRPQEEKE